MDRSGAPSSMVELACNAPTPLGQFARIAKPTPAANGMTLQIKLGDMPSRRRRSAAMSSSRWLRLYLPTPWLRWCRKQERQRTIEAATSRCLVVSTARHLDMTQTSKPRGAVLLPAFRQQLLGQRSRALPHARHRWPWCRAGGRSAAVGFASLQAFDRRRGARPAIAGCSRSTASLSWVAQGGQIRRVSASLVGEILTPSDRALRGGRHLTSQHQYQLLLRLIHWRK